MEEKMRADIALVKRGLMASRERAQSLIAAGLVTLNGKLLEKPSIKVAESEILAVLGTEHPYVSRGGLKLEKALQCFHVNPLGQVCMDIGASTGGFTDVLLQNGARRVYAIDVGHSQLDPRLAEDPRVTNMEHVNARALTVNMFPEAPSLAVMDVSFISIRLILPAALSVLGAQGRLISLIKPQFEAGKAHIGKHGVISNPSIHADVLKTIVNFAPTLGWHVHALDFSPIAGTQGNLEFLADFQPGICPEILISDSEIECLVRRAHDALSL